MKRKLNTPEKGVEIYTEKFSKYNLKKPSYKISI